MSNQHAAPPPGTVLVGKYRVEREIGSGAMGVVVEASHLHLGQRVAIKLLDPRLANEPEVLARFLREARIAATLPSEHVTKAIDVGQTETGVPYLVMELLTGHDLSTELERRGRLEVSAAVDYILQACEGVAEAHAAGLVHRDLKPANLFLAKRPGRRAIVKVLDFGLVTEPESDKAAMKLTAAGAVFGTPQYMSPEQVQSTSDVDARSDQHALGMILFELITGRPAYVAPNVTQLMLAIATREPARARSLRADVPARLEEALARALAKKPADRFPDLAGFAGAIAPFGGPSAAQSAASVRTALSPPPSSGAPPGMDAATRGTKSSHPDLTSSMDPAKGIRRARRRFALMAVLTAVALGIAAGLFAARWSPSSAGTTATASAGSATASAGSATASAAEPPKAPDSAPVVVPAPDPVPSGTAAAEPATSADPAASAATPGIKKPRTTGPRPGTGKPGANTAIGVFGDRKK